MLLILGLRVLALAKGKSLQDLIFMGIVGLTDPPRPLVRETIEILRQSGVRVKMVTGDSQETAVAIGKLKIKKKLFLKILIFCLNFAANLIGLDTVHHQVLSGAEMDQMNDMQIEKIINNVSIFYRVTPKHKVIIVKVYTLL